MSSINTSETAERSIEAIRRRVQRLVLAYLREHGPSIHQTMEDFYSDNYGPSTIRARCAELVRLGLVRDSGRIGLTRARRPAIVWEAV